MSKWKCEICNSEFDNYQAQGFNGIIYCPLCYFKELYKREKQENERLKELCDKYEEEHSNEFKIWKEERHKLLDYKSRCEKAVEYMQDFIFEPLLVQEDRKLIMFNENLKNFENILQNGSEKDDC